MKRTVGKHGLWYYLWLSIGAAYFTFALSSKVTPWPAIPHYDAESRGSLLCLWLFVGFRIVMDPASKCGMTWVFTWQYSWQCPVFRNTFTQVFAFSPTLLPRPHPRHSALRRGIQGKSIMLVAVFVESA